MTRSYFIKMLEAEKAVYTELIKAMEEYEPENDHITEMKEKELIRFTTITGYLDRLIDKVRKEEE